MWGFAPPSARCKLSGEAEALRDPTSDLLRRPPPPTGGGGPDDASGGRRGVEPALALTGPAHRCQWVNADHFARPRPHGAPMPTDALFQPFSFKGLTLPNRIVMAPM